jgi:hypothetical protein
MKFNSPLILSPPWGSVDAWQEANISIDFHLKPGEKKLRTNLSALFRANHSLTLTKT